MRKKLLFETKEEMLSERDSLVEQYLKNGGTISILEPQTTKTWEDDPLPRKNGEGEEDLTS